MFVRLSKCYSLEELPIPGIVDFLSQPYIRGIPNGNINT